jgi:hypothetical protein
MIPPTHSTLRRDSADSEMLVMVRSAGTGEVLAGMIPSRLLRRCELVHSAGCFVECPRGGILSP